MCEGIDTHTGLVFPSWIQSEHGPKQALLNRLEFPSSARVGGGSGSGQHLVPGKHLFSQLLTAWFSHVCSRSRGSDARRAQMVDESGMSHSLSETGDDQLGWIPDRSLFILSRERRWAQRGGREKTSAEEVDLWTVTLRSR